MRRKRKAAVLVTGLLGTVFGGTARAQTPFADAVRAAEAGRVDRAYALIQRAAAAEPDSAPVQFWLGEIATLKARAAGFGFTGFLAARKARAGFARAAQLHPFNRDYLQGLTEFLAQAPGIVGGDRDSALVLARRLRSEDDVRGTLVLADVLRQGGAAERRRADSLVAALLAAHPGDPLAMGGAANYFGLTGRPGRGVPLDSALVARDSTDALARYGLARLLVMERHPRRAQPQLAWLLARAAQVVAVAATPGAPGRRFWFSPADAWLLLGRTYRQLGVADSARACYRRALALDPGYAQARRALDSMPASASTSP